MIISIFMYKFYKRNKSLILNTGQNTLEILGLKNLDMFLEEINWVLEFLMKTETLLLVGLRLLLKL